MTTSFEIRDAELREVYGMLTREELIEALIKKHKECRDLSKSHAKSDVAIDKKQIKKIPFYPNVLEWWRDMDDDQRLLKITSYWGNLYTVDNISNILIYATFLFEKDNGNVDDMYIKNVIYN